MFVWFLSLLVAAPMLVTIYVITFASLWGPERSARGLARAMFIGAAPVGIIGFSAGYFGPILLWEGGNQGPLLGIFLAGPGGFVLGGLAGALWWRLVKHASLTWDDVKGAIRTPILRRIFLALLALLTGIYMFGMFLRLVAESPDLAYIIGLCLAAAMWIASKDPFRTPWRAFVFGTLMWGSVGFVFGFIGIAVIALLMGQDPTMAPLWGFVLGPLGFLFGGVAALVARKRRSSGGRVSMVASDQAGGNRNDGPL